MDIVKRNFISLLRSGAFDDPCPAEPMSDYKWRQLLLIALAQDCGWAILNGIENDAGHNMPLNIISEFKDSISIESAPGHFPDFGASNFNTPFLRRKLDGIRQGEIHAIDTSVETLRLLNIIVYSTQNIFSRGFSIGYAAFIGNYLREQGDKVDFVKLDSWLHALHSGRMAQFLGSVLIMMFNFEKDEIPFVSEIEGSALKTAEMSLNGKHAETYEEWHCWQDKSGIVHNNSKAFFQTLKRCADFFVYAPLEAAGYFAKTLVSGISEIEE